jgi:hypothetical protein
MLKMLVVTLMTLTFTLQVNSQPITSAGKKANTEEGVTKITCLGNDPKAWNKCIGEFTYPNGNKYIGDYKNGRRDGFGTMRIVAKGELGVKGIKTPSPSTYVGEFKRDKLNGHGIITYDDGNKIEGDFIDNVKQ